MTEFLPRELREGLEAARRGKAGEKRRMRLEVGGQSFTILRYWEDGFSLAAEDAPRLRGLVDLYEGPQHLGQCLIVATGEEAGEMSYEFKRNRSVADQPAADFVREERARTILLPKL